MKFTVMILAGCVAAGAAFAHCAQAVRKSAASQESAFKMIDNLVKAFEGNRG